MDYIWGRLVVTKWGRSGLHFVTADFLTEEYVLDHSNHLHMWIDSYGFRN